MAPSLLQLLVPQLSVVEQAHNKDYATTLSILDFLEAEVLKTAWLVFCMLEAHRLVSNTA